MLLTSIAVAAASQGGTLQTNGTVKSLLTLMQIRIDLRRNEASVFQVDRIYFAVMRKRKCEEQGNRAREDLDCEE